MAVRYVMVLIPNASHVCFAVKGRFGDVFDGSMHYLPINEAHHVLASGISWLVLLCIY